MNQMNQKSIAAQISRVHLQFKEEIKSHFCKEEFISFTHDAWNAPNVTEFMAVTAHFVTKNFELKDITLAITRRAKEKIEENQAQKDAQKISKMGELAATFTDSFDQVMTEIKTAHTYEEQEQIYDGFIKLLEQQRELLLARKELASKLKSSVIEPLSNRPVD